MKKCPFLKSKCIGDDCALYAEVVVTKPTTDGENITVEKACSIRMLVPLLIENSAQSRQNAASMDKVANEIAAGAGQTMMNFLAKQVRQLEKSDEDQPLPLTK